MAVDELEHNDEDLFWGSPQGSGSGCGASGSGSLGRGSWHGGSGLVLEFGLEPGSDLGLRPGRSRSLPHSPLFLGSHSRSRSRE